MPSLSAHLRLIRGCRILGAALLALAAGAVHAVPPSGNAQLAGVLTLGAAGADFLPSAGVIGRFTVLLGNGSFASLVGTGGDILDLANANLPDNLLRFDAAPDLATRGGRVLAGVFTSAACFSPPAAGQSCTPPMSALNLVNLARQRCCQPRRRSTCATTSRASRPATTRY